MRVHCTTHKAHTHTHISHPSCAPSYTQDAVKKERAAMAAKGKQKQKAVAKPAPAAPAKPAPAATKVTKSKVVNAGA